MNIQLKTTNDECNWEHLQDEEAYSIIKHAIMAILHARSDGQALGKHSPESWKEETIENNLRHSLNHIESMIARGWDDNVEAEMWHEFILSEAEHALCRLAIAIALYKRNEKNDEVSA